MLSKNTAISVRGLGKAYTIRHKAKETTLAEELLGRLKNPFGKVRSETFWAVQDVSFDIERGDIIGLIGKNGAGKSTLLKILGGITTPTHGEAVIRGRVGSLIEVGTGFHQELTGRENIYLNGAILGMSQREVNKRFDEIVDFAGVEEFLDTPVKRYSSGMYIRLAFAVAAHLDTDILLVDEVLSVGDAEFQRKCLGRLGDVADSGRTVIFVSHNLATLEALCSRGLLFDKGRLRAEGSLADVLAEYRHFDLRASQDMTGEFSRQYNFFRSADLVDNDGVSTRTIPMGSEITLRVLVDSDRPIEYPRFEVMIDSALGQRMLTVKSPKNERAIPRLDGISELVCKLGPLPLAPGNYAVKFELGRAGSVLEETEPELAFQIVNADAFNDGWGASTLGVCISPAQWALEKVEQPSLGRVGSSA